MAEHNNDEASESGCSFQWDENSQLYYHASSGFYHDPQAGWYYSTRDGLYYKFQNGDYVLLDSHQGGNQPNLQGETSEAQTQGTQLSDGACQDPLAGDCSEPSQYPPPPSEWLEETLIDMYLSGYSNRTIDADTSDMTMPSEINDAEELSPQENDDIEDLEEGEWIPDDPHYLSHLSEYTLEEGVTEEEENWRAQYGQVRQSDKDWTSDLQVVEIWDWALAKGMKKDGKTEVAKLVGRLRKRSSKNHPSLPSGGGKLKTAPVCEVYLDMVRVTSGRIYRLKIPSLEYVASLPFYDASNPTKDWGFPQLSISGHTEKSPIYDCEVESQSVESLGVQMERSPSLPKRSTVKKDHNYRDRAAERRALHGGFGVGPGQKKSLIIGDDSDSSSPPPHHELAAVESLNISFGEGSYARKILESMGWKEGEALGGSTKGLTEPLAAIGNKGNAGLGWNDGRRK